MMIRKRKQNLTGEEKLIQKRNELAKSGKVAAIWTRVSSADQYKHNYSIDTQKQTCREYCEHRGIRIKGYFGGDNESAKCAGDKFMDMIGAVCDDPEYNTIVVFDFDRFSRNSNDGIVFKTSLKKKGISVESVNQPLDQNNVLAEQIENILIIIADIDNAMRRHKCHDGMVACVNRGELYSRPPFGYDSRKVGKEHIITVNEQGHLLKHAFEWIANEPELSQAEVMRKLKAVGLVISKQKLSTCLHNNFYCGLLEHKYLDGKVIRGKQEALITEALFNRVQEILSKNSSQYRQEEETVEFPLKMHVFCAKDGHALSGYTVRKKGISYYKCGIKGCKTNVSAKELHSKYSDILRELVIPDNLRPILEMVLRKKFEEKNTQVVDEVADIKRNLHALKTKLKNAKVKFMTEDGISVEDYNEVKADFELKISNAELELKKLDSYRSNLADYTSTTLKIASELASTWEKKDFTVCQKIQHLVFPDGVVWDGETRSYRTDGMNEFFRQIALLRTPVANADIKKSGR